MFWLLLVTAIVNKNQKNLTLIKFPSSKFIVPFSICNLPPVTGIRNNSLCSIFSQAI